MKKGRWKRIELSRRKPNTKRSKWFIININKTTSMPIYLRRERGDLDRERRRFRRSGEWRLRGESRSRERLKIMKRNVKNFRSLPAATFTTRRSSIVRTPKMSTLETCKNKNNLLPAPVARPTRWALFFWFSFCNSRLWLFFRRLRFWNIILGFEQLLDVCI